MITIKNTHRSIYLNTRQYSCWHMFATEDKIHLYIKEPGRADEEYVLTYDLSTKLPLTKLPQGSRIELVSKLSDLLTESLSAEIPLIVDFKELLKECQPK